MSKNKVKERCKREEHAKFYYASKKMFFDLKASRIFLYCLAIIPVVLTFIPNVSGTYVFVCSIVSFMLSILNECLTSFLNEYKKKAIMQYQLYETGITGSEFSKIEYDRETTNELNELAIRKGLLQMRKTEKVEVVDVPEEISDDYSYLYLCRKSAATNKFLLSRLFYIYFAFLVLIAVAFVFAVFFKKETFEYLTLIITFYPLVSPIIKACGKCKECMRDCTKICADIDNYFADGDTSIERLARMHYYVQNLEFEMMTNRPTIYNVFVGIFRQGTDNLQEGVTERFKSAIIELKGKSMMHKGIIAQPKGKALITKVDYDLDKLNKIEKVKKHKVSEKDSKAQKKTKKEVAKQPTKKGTSALSKNLKANKKPVEKKLATKVVKSKKLKINKKNEK